MTGSNAQGTSRILLVDDEENILRSLSRVLMEEDLEILTATSGEAGLALLREHGDVALILSDQRMPGMSGAEFLEKARAMVPDAMRMVLTGYADISAAMDAINKGGASRYIAKPWDDQALVQTIRDGVEHYRLLQENRRLQAVVEKQNAELKEWNDGLKGRLMEQTATIRRQNEELKERNRRIDRAFRHTIVAFSRLIELHSSKLQQHTRNVTELSVRAACALQLGEEEVETIRTAALLHDIGVVGIPSEILEKPLGQMNREEQEIFLQHAVRGQATVDEVEELRQAGLLIRHHHELYGGNGFPDGIGGTDIPLGARIIAFADFVDREMEEQTGENPVSAVLETTGKVLGSRLDPELFAVMEPQVRELYHNAASQRAEASEKELRPRQLMPGMQATRDVYTRSGLLLLARGTVLDAGRIAAVTRTCTVDPPAGGIHVSWHVDVNDAGPTRTIEPRRMVQHRERELLPGQLVEGMRITRNLYTGTGLLLLAEGTVLGKGEIVSVRRFFDIDPPSGGIFVAAELGP